MELKKNTEEIDLLDRVIWNVFKSWNKKLVGSLFLWIATPSFDVLAATHMRVYTRSLKKKEKQGE